MNDAPTTGYEVDVGNKTSFRVVAHSSLYRVLKRPQEFVNKTPETIFIFWGPPAKMQKSLLKIIQRVSASFPNMTAYIVSPSRMKQFDDLFRGETGKDRYLRATSCTASPPFLGPWGRAGSWGCSMRSAAARGCGSLGQVGDPGGGLLSMSPLPRPHPVSPPQGEVALVAQHRLVHHGDRSGAVRRRPRLWHGATQLLRVRRPLSPQPSPASQPRCGAHPTLSPAPCSRRPPPRRLPYHYYEPKGPDECTTYIHNERSRKGNHHRFITEKRVFASWAGLYNITFSHPAWP